MKFRPGTESDADAIGALHVASWRETYTGIIPDEVLAELSVEERSKMWGRVLGDSDGFGSTAVFVAETENEIVGFGACGVQRDEVLKEQGFGGEVGAMYVLRSHQGAGAGKSLIYLMARKLMEQGHTAATLWVLRENVTARAFYERLGGTVVGARVDEQSSVILSEVAYGWRDLSALAS